MRFLPGRVTLSEIVGGTLNSGYVPLGRFTRFSSQAVNAGLVTVTGAITSLVTINCGDVVAGDLVDVTAFLSGTKGATAGNTWAVVQQSAGTATIGDVANMIGQSDSYHPAAANVTLGCFPFIEVTGSGTLTVEFAAKSAGSNTTVNANAARLRVRVLRGS